MKSITLKASIDEAIAAKIKSLETKITRLETKVKRQDTMISNLKRGASFSKEKRNMLLIAVADLVSELEDEEWIDIDRYYSDF